MNLYIGTFEILGLTLLYILIVVALYFHEKTKGERGLQQKLSTMEDRLKKLEDEKLKKT